MYREVRMVEITEVLRLWRAGVPKKRIAARLGLDPKTVRRYVTVAEATGLRVGAEARERDAAPGRAAGAAPRRRPTAGRRLGSVSRAARRDSRLAERRPPADQDSKAAEVPGHRSAGVVSCALP